MLTNTVSCGLAKNGLNAFGTFDLSESVGCKDNWSADGSVDALFLIKAALGVTAEVATVTTTVALGNNIQQWGFVYETILVCFVFLNVSAPFLLTLLRILCI